MDIGTLLTNPMMWQYVIGPLVIAVLGLMGNLIYKRTGIEIKKDQQTQMAAFFKSMVLQAEEKGEANKKVGLPLDKKEFATNLAATEVKEALPFVSDDKAEDPKWLEKKVVEAVAVTPTVGATATVVITDTDLTPGYKISP
jgi:hypothetical protein